MKRTAEELVALRLQREQDDGDKDRKARKAASRRAKRRKMRGGDLIDELKLSAAELQGLVLDAGDKATRAKWARMGSRVQEVSNGGLEEAAAE